MALFSTKNRNHKVPLREAVLKGLAPDGGLYLLENIPKFRAGFLEASKELSFINIACEVACTLLGDEVEQKVLVDAAQRTITFNVPLIPLGENRFSLELFHGPTLAFKDFGARFMAALTQHFVEEADREVTILVATSGDTGGAVAHGFYNMPGIKVVILYPKGKVSPLQEKQLTTLGGNVTALEVSGNFDDCQRMVKEAFVDSELNQKRALSSANSINIARLVPQSFYYVYAYSRLPDHDLPTVFSVPSGNFGNLTAGIIAKKMGLPVERFVAATNLNDTVPRFLHSGRYEPKNSIPTISNAMDVGDPSNFVRLKSLLGDTREDFSKAMTGFSFTDDETRDAIKRVWGDNSYILDPHGAVAYLGLEKDKEISKSEYHGILLETAHPIKFAEVVEPIIGESVEIPIQLTECMNGKKISIEIKPEYSELRDFLLS